MSVENKQKDAKEQKFYKALQDVFIGAQVEGKGGFVNLMKIKSNYYRKIENILKNDIESALQLYPDSDFRDELFDKLYTFFSRYFSESGSIYFNSTPFHNNIYEKVYTDDKDVVLFWKTQMLYYVKTDRIFRSLDVDVDGVKFFFDASKIENKKANEKRSLVYKFNKVNENGTIVLDVFYSEKGTKTKQEEILKALKKNNIAITEEQLERAFRTFEKQSEVDFFINKNAKAFLQEQFKLWYYRYFWEGAKEWSSDRVNQLQIIKDIAFKIIDFIAQFEDELVKIWNKPKFVKNSNYVITLDRIQNINLIKAILTHRNITEQVKEWQDLGIVDKDFAIEDVLADGQLSDKYKHLPIDTKYFKDLELEIIGQFDNLDKALDGWLIKSENYQALNTILPKFKERVQTIYIDPPFNTGSDFAYLDRFQNSSWISLMFNRLEKARDLINERGSLFLHLDYHADYYGRIIMNQIFGEENFRNGIVWHYGLGGSSAQNFPLKHDYILFYSKGSEWVFNPILVPASSQLMQGKFKKMDNVWDIPSINNMAIERVAFFTQKPEALLERIIKTSSNSKDIILDFFLGSGTTTAVAHKLGRKWIGVEMGEHFYDVILHRMKKVLAYDKSGISKEVKEYQGGGFFKYYELEQYEETLANCKYEDGDLFTSPSKTPYQEYVFMKDEKMLKALEIDYENNKVKVDLDKLYPNIDIAETLSNLTGKWIKRITDEEVELEDGTKINTKDLDYKLVKPLIWWE